MKSEAIGTIIDTVLVVVIVFGACMLDLFNNPVHHPRKYVIRRFLNWFLVGITYASTYFGRYNMNVANQPATYNFLEVDSSSFGTIITVGFASYAFFVVVNGFVVDKIGARNAMTIGALGSAVFNVFEGIFAAFVPLKGLGAIAVICILYACNNYFQTFCTSAICKVGAVWYTHRERGYFSGIFGVIISLGFFFAFQVNGVVYDSMNWSFIFFFPALQLAILGMLNCFFTCNTPEDAGVQPNLENKPLLSVNTPDTPPVKPSLLVLFKTVFANPIFWLLCTVDIGLGWCRDGVLSWYTAVLDGRFGCDTSSNQYALASGGTTIGGMFGSLSAGILSDLVFCHRRIPVAVIYFVILTCTYIVMFFAESGYAFATLVGIAAMWLNGLNGLITSTCAMDFAGNAVGTAVGLLDGVQKIGSSLTGVVMGVILDISGDNSDVTKKHYDNWLFSMFPVALCAACLLLPIIMKKAPEAATHDSDTLKKEVVEEAVSEAVEEVERGMCATLPGTTDQ